MMESRAKVMGHSLHQMLIVFPLGLLGTAVVFDLIHLGTGHPRWAEVSFWMIAAGVVGGLVAAPPGLIDWLAIPSGTRAKAVGAWHAIGNVIVLGAFAASWFLRREDPGAPGTAALALSIGGLVLSLVTAWLGGELVSRLGVGVYPGAHLNSPSSLSDRPASAGSDGRAPASA
jgi:uncharacterized membrane protein